MLTRNRIGQVLDNRYELRRLLGRGAMSEVFCAYDSNRKEEVAIKLLRPDLVQNEEVLQRFLREVRAHEIIHHRNVAALYGGGASPWGEPYLVVELLVGRSLRTIIHKEGRVPLERAVDYCCQALQGLAASHSLGISHRDLKPANIMIETADDGSERAVLIDFGYALLAGSSRITLQGHVVGSLSYLAPERLSDLPNDERADIYAMGVILYELLVGRPPFVADDDFQLINAHLSAEPLPPGLVAPECNVNPSLERVIMRALSKDPKDRPQSAAQMARDLQQGLTAVI